MGMKTLLVLLARYFSVRQSVWRGPVGSRCPGEFPHLSQARGRLHGLDDQWVHRYEQVSDARAFGCPDVLRPGGGDAPRGGLPPSHRRRLGLGHLGADGGDGQDDGRWPSGFGDLAGAAGGRRLRHPHRVALRRPGDHVRRGGDDGRVSHDGGGGRRLHPRRQRYPHRLRRGRHPGRQAACGARPPARRDPRRRLRRAGRRGVGAEPGRPGGYGGEAPGRETDARSTRPWLRSSPSIWPR